MAIKLPTRQIHLDFHTGPDIPDVGADFDAKTFAQTYVDAHVNSVTLFAKCHHGLLYYNTKHPARHPGLKPGHDLLAQQIDALHRVGIQAPIYLSVLWDQFAAEQHPEWLAIDANGSRSRPPFRANFADWDTLDMASPYADYLADQINEVSRKFKPADGIFLDICFNVDCASKWVIDAMKKRGMDPTDVVERDRFQTQLTREYMARYNKIIQQAQGNKGVKIWYNSRPKVNLPAEKKLIQHIEIEALPTGKWGYHYFPLNVRYARVMGLPYLGMTGRFHKSWADFGGLKTQPALDYEIAQMLAHGAACSIGDQLHPRGTTDKAAYQLIRSAYAYVEKCEPWTDGAKPVTEVAMLRSYDDPYFGEPGHANAGTVRMLEQLKMQFDVIPPDFNFAPYRILIVHESIKPDADLIKRLRAFVKAGGHVLISGPAAVNEQGESIMPELGIKPLGESPYQTTYVRFDRSLDSLPTDHVMYEKGLRMVAANKSVKVLARIVEPYFARTWEHWSSHCQPPADKLSRFAAVIQSKAGKGTFTTFCHPIFRAYAVAGNVWIRHLISQVIDRVLPEPLLRVQGPSFLETSVTRKGKKTMVHLIGYLHQRRTPDLDLIEDTITLGDLPVSLRITGKPGKVTLVPEGDAIDFTCEGGRVNFTVPKVAGHQIVCVE